MATMRYAQSATEMIPRMRFSIKFWSKFLAAERIKHKCGEKHNHQSDVNEVQHNLFGVNGRWANRPFQAIDQHSCVNKNFHRFGPTMMRQTRYAVEMNPRMGIFEEFYQSFPTANYLQQKSH